MTRLDSRLPGYASAAVSRRSARRFKGKRANTRGSAGHAALPSAWPMSGCFASPKSIHRGLEGNGYIRRLLSNPASRADQAVETTTGPTTTSSTSRMIAIRMCPHVSSRNGPEASFPCPAVPEPQSCCFRLHASLKRIAAPLGHAERTSVRARTLVLQAG